MKRNEIRIGNFLKWKDNGQVFDVTIGLMLSKHFWNHIKEGDILPIPLTKKRLKEFGFDTTYSQIRIIDDLWSITLESDLSTYDVIVNGEYQIASVKFVHKLQNLYFELRNEELKRNG